MAENAEKLQEPLKNKRITRDLQKRILSIARSSGYPILAPRREEI
jgi:hypothetical protein